MDSSDLVYVGGITPSDLGLPEKFDSWRQDQLKAIDRSLKSDRRFISHAIPTGGGKSVTYIAEALFRGCRCAILTSTKGLQDQLLGDFSSVGLVSVKGKQNFMCRSGRGWTCEEGSHAACSDFVGDSGHCPYKQQYNAALKSKLVVTNYAYWTAIHKYGEGLGDFDLLVLDEAHDCPDEVCSINTVQLSSRDVLGALRTEWPRQPLYIAGWSTWAKQHLPRAVELANKAQGAARIARDMHSIREAVRTRNLVTKLGTLSGMTGEWVVEPVVKNRNSGDEGTDGWKIEPIWPAQFAEKSLFRGIKKIVLVSATLSRATLRLLGIAPGTYDHYEYPSQFPPARSPVYSIPTVKLNYKSGSEDYYLLIERLDEIIAGRLDRKGIIHTTSYDRALKILQGSKYSAYMVTHSNRPGEAMQISQRFRTMEAPAILLSPSMSTGYDFPSSTCEYQIVVKAPYPDLRSRVMQRRMEVDRQYPAYTMAQTLVQACGRGMRSKTDQCETFILDDVVEGVVKRSSDLFPQWWKKLYRSVNRVPQAPPPIDGTDSEQLQS